MKFPKTWKVNRPKDFQAMKKQKEKYPDQVMQILDTSDVIIQVLDARFPEETRNKPIEDIVKKKRKKLIFVLNKSDLVDKEKYKVPNEIKPFVFVSSKNREGSRALRELIKQQIKSRNEKFNRSQVGIIGYPNTGKSSLINFLIGKASAKTAYEAGFTKGIQKLRLTKEILLMDTPGVIPKEKYSHTEHNKLSHHVKVGARNYDKVKDPEFIVADLVKEYSNEIGAYYNLDFKQDPEVLIEQLGRKRNFLSKGGIVDEDRTARSILRDWQEGKIVPDM